MSCAGRDASARRESMTSRAVSVAAQKKGGDSHQPIWRQFGTTSMMLSMSDCGSVVGIV